MWARAVNIALGIWLMAAPDVLGYRGPLRINHEIVGPLLASFAMVAMWQVTQSLRWANFVLGLWLASAPWLLGYDSNAALANSVAVGAATIACSLVRGKTRHRMNGGWPSLWSGADS